jgi:hypothetical protein
MLRACQTQGGSRLLSTAVAGEPGKLLKSRPFALILHNKNFVQGDETGVVLGLDFHPGVH